MEDLTDRRFDDETRAWMDRRLRRTLRRQTLAIVLLAAFVTAAIAVGYLQNRHRVDDLKRSRSGAILLACREQNARHDATVVTLDRLLRVAERREPARAAQIRQSRQFTVLLIDALAPKRDCEQQTRELTR